MMEFRWRKVGVDLWKTSVLYAERRYTVLRVGRAPDVILDCGGVRVILPTDDREVIAFATFSLVQMAVHLEHRRSGVSVAVAAK